MISIRPQLKEVMTITIPEHKTVLVAEDDKNRIEWFEKKLHGTKFVICQTPRQALDVLKTQSFDVVFLDHDAVSLFVQEYHPQYSELTFFPVARQLSRIEYKGTIVIHSQNPVGARRMKLELDGQNVHVMPFGQFDLKVDHYQPTYEMEIVS
jgi:CheY-like chemotaxis protein